MEEPSYRLTARELVVQLHSGAGLKDVDLDAAFLQVGGCLGHRVQPQFDPAAQHCYLAAVIDEFLHISWLDAWLMAGPGLRPVPLPASAAA